MYIPLEVAKVPAQHCPQQNLKPEHTKRMVRQTAMKAPQQQKEIEYNVRDAQFDSDVYLSEFGIQVKERMLSITGRVLEPPRLQAKQETCSIIPRDGAWRMA